MYQALLAMGVMIIVIGLIYPITTLFTVWRNFVRRDPTECLTITKSFAPSQNYGFCKMLYIYNMKKILIISCGIGLLLGISSVSCAGHELHKPPKIEKHELPVMDMSDMIVTMDIHSFTNGSVPSFMGTVVEKALIPTGSVSYLVVKKENYISPFVDRSWVWFNSLITNS
jgi:hypothetical protein